MSKRIYFPKDSVKLQQLSRKTGIPLSRLKEAAAGRLELTAEERRKVNLPPKVTN